jgi:Tol biopolymer transport system component
LLASADVARSSEYHVDIVAIGLTGKQTDLTQSPSFNASPAPAPDGQIAFVSDRAGTTDLYVMDGDGGNVQRLTTNAHIEGGAEDLEVSHVAWSPQGHTIAFDTAWGPVEPNCPQHCDGWAVSVVRSDGSGLGKIAQSARAPAWSPNGARLAYDSGVDVVDYDDAGSVTIARPDGSSAVQVPATRNSSLIGPVWSPPGDELAFEAQKPDKSAATSIYLVDASGQHRRRLTTGHDPTWSPDGRRIVFVYDYKLVAIDANGTGRRRLSPKGEFVVTAAWSPKSGTIAYVAGTTRDPYAYLPRNLRVEAVSSEGKHVRVLAREPGLFVDEPPVWTADGRRILVAAA